MRLPMEEFPYAQTSAVVIREMNYYRHLNYHGCIEKDAQIVTNFRSKTDGKKKPSL